MRACIIAPHEKRGGARARARPGASSSSCSEPSAAVAPVQSRQSRTRIARPPSTSGPIASSTAPAGKRERPADRVARAARSRRRPSRRRGSRRREQHRAERVDQPERVQHRLHRVRDGRAVRSQLELREERERAEHARPRELDRDARREQPDARDERAALQQLEELEPPVARRVVSSTVEPPPMRGCVRQRRSIEKSASGTPAPTSPTSPNAAQPASACHSSPSQSTRGSASSTDRSPAAVLTARRLKAITPTRTRLGSSETAAARPATRAPRAPRA